VSAISDLLTHYQHVISDLRVVTGSKGVFDVVVDGTTIYSKHEAGRHAEPGEVLQRFTEHIGADVPRYKDE
jgi:selenoprotein W-related protein